MFGDHDELARLLAAIVEDFGTDMVVTKRAFDAVAANGYAARVTELANGDVLVERVTW